MLTQIEKADRKVNKSFKDLNPYRGCDKIADGSRRFNATVGTDDFNFILFLRGTLDGTTSTTVCVLWAKLVKELERRGITSYAERLEFEQFIEDCIITTPDQSNYEKGYKNGYIKGQLDSETKHGTGVSLGELVQRASGPNDLRAKAGNDIENQVVAGQPSPVQKIPKRAKRRGGSESS